MGDTLALAVAGETLQLHADRALYWPARRRLLVADLHLGKGEILRTAGIPVPRGGTAQDLARLDRLIGLFQPEALWFLGDLLHGARTEGQWRGQWQAWRQRHAGIAMTLLPGNHDRAARTAQLGVTCLEGDVADGGLVFSHQPGPARPAGVPFRLCGHLHPVVRLPGLPGRFPAFQRTRDHLVLPAFSAFTGGLPVPPDAEAIACADGFLVPVRLPP